MSLSGNQSWDAGSQSTGVTASFSQMHATLQHHDCHDCHADDDGDDDILGIELLNIRWRWEICVEEAWSKNGHTLPTGQWYAPSAVINDALINTLQYIAIPCNSMQYHAYAIHYNTMQHQALPCNTIQYHAIPCNIMQYHAIPCNTMQYHAIQCNTMQYNAIPCNTMHH